MAGVSILQNARPASLYFSFIESWAIRAAKTDYARERGGGHWKYLMMF